MANEEAEEAESYHMYMEFVCTVEALCPAGRYMADGLAEGLPNRILLVPGMDHILSWPCPPASAAAGISVVERALFGRRTRTVVDPAVRSSWRFRLADVSFGSTQRWERALAGVEVRDGLCVTFPNSAELHNLRRDGQRLYSAPGYGNRWTTSFAPPS